MATLVTPLPFGGALHDALPAHSASPRPPRVGGTIKVVK